MKDRGKDIGIRLASMLLDHIITTFIIFIAAAVLILVFLGLVFLFTGFEDGAKGEENPIRVLFGVLFVTFIFSIYFNKDSIGGRSVAKRILNLVVVNHKTGEVASPARTVLRNITIFFWPLEVLFVLFSPDRRIGDFIAGTQVVEYREEHKTKTKFLGVLGGIFLGMLYLIIFLVLQLFLFGFDLYLFDGLLYG